MTSPPRPPTLLASLTIVTLVACAAPDSTAPNAMAPTDAPLAGRGGGTTSYSVTSLPAPAGYASVNAGDVNDAGTVVGYLTAGNDVFAFARLSGALVALPPTTTRSVARAVSNGDPTYVVGWIGVNGNSQPARWTISGGSFGNGQILANGGYGVAAGVNDRGEAVGGRRIWGSTGAVVADVTPPAGFSRIDLLDINNVGLVAMNASGSATSLDRAYLRPSTGEAILLAPPAGMEDYFTYADAVSERSGDVVYVAGKVQRGESECYAARWTVNVVSGLVTALSLRLENTGSAWGVSTGGTFVGHQGQGWTTKPFAWTLSGVAIGLPMPKGAKNPLVRAISPNGKHITGAGEFSGFERRGLLWSGNGP
jgi:hypothetical protein